MNWEIEIRYHTRRHAKHARFIVLIREQDKNFNSSGFPTMENFCVLCHNATLHKKRREDSPGEDDDDWTGKVEVSMVTFLTAGETRMAVF